MRVSCADQEKFFQGLLFSFFLANEWREDPMPLREGHHRPTSETPFKWRFAGRADDGPTLNAVLVAL